MDQGAYDSRDKSKTIVTICDINEQMLDVGKERAKAQGYEDGIFNSTEISIKPI